MGLTHSMQLWLLAPEEAWHGRTLHETAQRLLTGGSTAPGWPPGTSSVQRRLLRAENGCMRAVAKSQVMNVLLAMRTRGQPDGTARAAQDIARASARGALLPLLDHACQRLMAVLRRVFDVALDDLHSLPGCARCPCCPCWTLPASACRLCCAALLSWPHMICIACQARGPDSRCKAYQDLQLAARHTAAQGLLVWWSHAVPLL